MYLKKCEWGVLMKDCLYVSKVNICRNREFLKYDIFYPIIKLKQNYICYYEYDLYIINKINSIIYNYIMGFKSEIEKEAKEYKKYYNQILNSEEEKYIKYKYEAYTNYDLTYHKNNIVSIPMTMYKFTGGAHGMTYLVSYNYDLLTGKRLLLKNLFKEGVDYKFLINNLIKYEINKNKELYFIGDEGFISISDDQKFYIDNDKIVIYFDLYEIAPYYVGLPKFEVPFDDYKKYLLYS